LKIQSFEIGDFVEDQEYSFDEIITEKMIDDFVSVSGDCSPIHTSDEFAKSKGFQGRIVHGAFLASLLSQLVGVHFPGENAMLVSMNNKFTDKCYINDKITVGCHVDQISTGTKTMVLKAYVKKTNSELILVKSKIIVLFTNA